MEDISKVNFGAVIKKVGSLRLVLTKTNKVHRCIVCNKFTPIGRNISIQLGSSSKRDYLHISCYPNYKLETRAKDYIRLPARTLSVKPNDLVNKLDRIIQELEIIYKDVHWSLTYSNYGYSVSCNIGKSVFSDMFNLNWTTNILKRRLSELLAYTLEAEEIRNAKLV